MWEIPSPSAAVLGSAARYIRSAENRARGAHGGE